HLDLHMTKNPLDRFHLAQHSPHAGFAAALAELGSTGKRGHWIWYVFPQLAGLGSSSQSREYGIRGLEEAAEDLLDPVLRSRLLAATRTVERRLQGRMQIRELMGSQIDSLKLVSSLTLFETVARRLNTEAPLSEYAELEEVAQRVLAMAEKQGYP